jgi:hypothetical protein
MVAGMIEIGQCCDDPLHEKEEGRPNQDTLAEPRPEGIHLLQMGCLLLMDRTSPEVVGHCLEHVVVCWDHLACVAAWRSPRRANVWLPGC